MKRKRVIVLGAGISGLTAAWYLSQTGEPLDITILERADVLEAGFIPSIVEGSILKKGHVL